MDLVQITHEGIKELVKEWAALLPKFLSPGVEQAGEMLGDQLRFLRFRRALALVGRARDIANEAGFSPSAANMRVLFPCLDSAVLEDDADMQERWASLLASAANPHDQPSSASSFIEILKQLAPTHAYLLDVFYEQISTNRLAPEQWSEQGYVLDDLRQLLKKEVPKFDVALENLLRLNLVAYPTAKLGSANGREVRITVTSSNILCGTSLGFAFTTACGHGRTPHDTSYAVSGNSISNVFRTRGGSLHLSPSPPAKAIPPGIIPEAVQLQLQKEAFDLAKQIGYDPGVGLIGRKLLVKFGKGPPPPGAIAPLVEFCAERELELQIHQPFN